MNRCSRYRDSLNGRAASLQISSDIFVNKNVVNMSQWEEDHRFTGKTKWKVRCYVQNLSSLLGSSAS